MISPAIIMLLGAGVLFFLPRRFRSPAFLIVPLIALVLIWTLPPGEHATVPFAGYTLSLFSIDSLSRIFGTIFSVIACAGGVYAFHIRKREEQIAALVYGAGALGVVFAGDLLTLFMFWELMAVSSLVLIWARGTKSSRTAGFRYLLVHLTGGSTLLAGIIMHIVATGSTRIALLSPDGSVATWLMLVGVGLNAAIPPLHAWLSDAYPEATVTGAVFLSAFTTKSAVYVLIRMFSGFEILILLGTVMALYGVVYAVLANDIRGILAYHIISQVGYMVAGVGIGTQMAINGVTAHAFSHILYKALLFMGAGVVLETTGKSRLTELGGLGKAMPLTVILYMIGAFSISGFPLFNGFISKSMVIAAAGESHHEIVLLLLNLASIGTFLHTGLKLPYFTWFGPQQSTAPVAKPPAAMHIGMGIVASLCILFGVAPGLLYAYLPFPVSYHPYTMSHLVETIQLLTFTFIGFWFLRAKLAGDATIALDTDWFYRRPARLLGRVIIGGTYAVFSAADEFMNRAAAAISRLARDPVSLASFGKVRGGEDGFDPDRTRPTLLFVLVLIIGALIVLAGASLIGR